MKTLATKTTLALTIAIVISTYIFASATFMVNSVNSKTSTIITNNAIANYEKAISVVYDFNDEEYINDIPFITNSICVEDEYQKAIAVDFEFEEESYIDDIPFNTQIEVL
ncbi:MAG: hypothetical protein HQ521_16465 [Bacteroidetes bacterium]|nr:hypothetical protein [Bacteroidota bacterium]